MATTHAEDSNFLNDVIGTGLLESSIEWIKTNLTPEDVFSKEVLCEWAENNDYIKSNE